MSRENVMKWLTLAVLVGLGLASPAAASWQKGVGATADSCDMRMTPHEVCWWVTTANDTTDTLDTKECNSLTFLTIEENGVAETSVVTWYTCEPNDGAALDCYAISNPLSSEAAFEAMVTVVGVSPFSRAIVTTVGAAGVSVGLACGE